MLAQPSKTKEAVSRAGHTAWQAAAGLAAAAWIHKHVPVIPESIALEATAAVIAAALAAVKALVVKHREQLGPAADLLEPWLDQQTQGDQTDAS